MANPGVWDAASLSLAADAVAGQSLSFGLFDGDPESGGTELSGGSYARWTPTFGSASNGVASASNDYAIPADSQFDWVAVYVGSTLKIKAQITQQTYSTAGTFTLTANVKAQ